MKRKIKDIIIDTDNKIEEINNQAKAAVDEAKRSALESTVDLFAEIGWNNWSAPQLESADQYFRLQKSFSDKMNIESIDYTSKSGQVRGSSVYDINEKGCTCKDFAIRGLPCKHMYFLAYHLANDKEQAPTPQSTEEQDAQIKLDDVSEHVAHADLEGFFISELGVLGCCDLYRKCSEAGHCLAEDEQHTECRYRENLKQGRIFFSKCANDFSQQRYDYIKSFRESLNETEKKAFDEIVLYFRFTKRGCARCFCLLTPEIEKVVSKCELFRLLTPVDLVSRIFDANLISNTRAENFHSKYSKLPAPELKPTIPKPKEETKEEERERKKQNQIINDENLQKWKKFYLSDHDLQNALAKYFLYFETTEYDTEFEEFFRDNYTHAPSEFTQLVFFDPDKPANFREKIV